MRQSIRTALAALISFAGMLFFPYTAMSEEKADVAKAKVLIYYFQNMTRSNDYGYYSYIIPDSISTELKKTEKYEVQAFPVVLDYIDDSASDDAYKKRIGFLSDRGKEFNADFVIMGSYTIEERTINIKTQIFNVEQQKIKDLKESSEELGVMLLVIIDNLSQKINSELGAGTEAKMEALRSSPFIPFYSSLNGISLDVHYGMMKMVGKWGDIYDKTEMVSIRAGYSFRGLEAFRDRPFLGNMYAGIEYDFFSAGNISNESGEKFFTLHGFLLDAGYEYRIFSFLSLSAQMGVGIADSIVEVMGSGSTGPPDVLISVKSVDPYLSLAAGVNLIAGNVRFTAGYAFKGIFLKNEPAYLSNIYFGAGFML